MLFRVGMTPAPETAMQPSSPTPDSPSAPAHVLPLPVSALARFRRLMQYEGRDVNLARLCIDTAYAQECLATAHTSGDERLRRVALDLFDAFGRNTVLSAIH